MSRSDYCDDFDCDNWSLIRWRGAVKAAMRGYRGQQLLRELREALDAMPVKRLIADELVKNGEACALGVLGQKRCMNMEGVDPNDSDKVAEMFGVAPALVREIVYENDEAIWDMTPEKRWCHMRLFVERHIIKTPSELAVA